jgi:hypothetical protein
MSNFVLLDIPFSRIQDVINMHILLVPLFICIIGTQGISNILLFLAYKVEFHIICSLQRGFLLEVSNKAEKIVWKDSKRFIDYYTFKIFQRMPSVL